MKLILRRRILYALAVVIGFSALATHALAVKVSVVKSLNVGLPELPVLDELDSNWPALGPIRVEIDLSLRDVEQFTYGDLVATGADVIWLSDPAGALKQYSTSEVEAIQRYVEEGHHLVGTYLVFRFSGSDNSALAPLFGLPPQPYNAGAIGAEQRFGLLQPGHPLFSGVPDPYASGAALAQAQVPVPDTSWDLEDDDFGDAVALARTEDGRGVITLYETTGHHAIYISELVEYFGNAQDTRLLYNVLTFRALPTGSCCVGDGSCHVLTEAECRNNSWQVGGMCSPNPCPQRGACCDDVDACSIAFEVDCAGGRWSEGTSCDADADGDDTSDGCDRCPGSDDRNDDDSDGVPDGCDACPGFDDLLDADRDGAPDDCDACPGSDDGKDGDQDGVPDGCDQCAGFDDAADCDDDTIPDGCDLPDCNGNHVPDNCDVDDKHSVDCDDNGIPDECEPDEDGDGITDVCDDCVGDDTLIATSCDSEIDLDDCRNGTFDCTTGVLVCSDDEAQDDVDSDGDGVFDCNDMCPGTPTGSDVLPDGCRPIGACCFGGSGCLVLPREDCMTVDGSFLAVGITCAGVEADPDRDGAAGCTDGCPFDGDKADPGQCGCGAPDTDSDGDDVADCVDGCPDDGAKIEPGVCGCDVPDDDGDLDGTPDCHDGCPDDPSKIEPGVCGCNVPDQDSDRDEFLDCEDGCPFDPAKQNPGVCGCRIPDIDSDLDGTLDCQESCPLDPDKLTPGVCGCGVPDIDTDHDQTLDCRDGCPLDPDKIDPGVCGCQSPDDDSDADTILDCLDDCPNTDAGLEVDDRGCPLFGACCFRGGICGDGSSPENCRAIGGTYQGNGSQCAASCRFPAVGDYDFNNRIDLDDFAHLPGCLKGPTLPLSPDNCVPFDFDGNGRIDLSDVSGLVQVIGRSTR